MTLTRLIALTSLLAVQTLCAQEKTITLESTFASVEKVNVNVLVSRETVSQSIAQANQQRANLLPHVSLDAVQKRARTVTIVNGTPLDAGVGDRFDGQLTGTYNILSPSQIASYRAARRGTEAANYDYNLTMQTVLTSLGQAYFLHQRNEQRLVVLDSNVDLAKVLLDLARHQLAAGVATQIDVTRAEAQLASAEQDRLQQETTVLQSEMLLKQLLDIDIATPLKVTPFAVRRIPQDLVVASYEKQALDQRPDYAKAQKQLAQNKDLLLAAKLEQLGTLDVYGQYGYATEVAFDGKQKKEWTGGVEFNLPLFDGLKIRADKRAALSQVRSQEFRIRSLELQISSELRLAMQDARSRLAQVEVAEKSLRLAQDELKLAQKRYEQGGADNREVVDAQNQLAQSNDNVVEAVYYYNLSRLELARSRGEVRTILSERAN